MSPGAQHGGADPQAGFHWPTERERLRDAGYEWVAGVDEAGCGAWAGPVVAAAALISLQAALPAVRDSKQLSPAQRERLFAEIHAAGLTVTVGLAYVPEVDQLNIFRAARLAMRRAVDQLLPRPQLVLMDGHLPPDFGVPCQAVVHGDALCPIISVASIVAKVCRDRLMERLGALYPEYGFELHRGYGTAEHREALARYGPSPVHRRSFAPVRAGEQLALEVET